MNTLDPRFDEDILKAVDKKHDKERKDQEELEKLLGEINIDIRKGNSGQSWVGWSCRRICYAFVYSFCWYRAEIHCHRQRILNGSFSIPCFLYPDPLICNRINHVWSDDTMVNEGYRGVAIHTYQYSLIPNEPLSFLYWSPNIRAADIPADQ